MRFMKSPVPHNFCSNCGSSMTTITVGSPTKYDTVTGAVIKGATDVFCCSALPGYTNLPFREFNRKMNCDGWHDYYKAEEK